MEGASKPSSPAELTDENPMKRESKPVMNIASQIAPPVVAGRPASCLPGVDADIRAFLAGENDGESLLHALYDDVLDEPIPERMLLLLLLRR
jgi:hypothetical protein